jgi:hypothetical protein
MFGSCASVLSFAMLCAGSLAVEPLCAAEPGVVNLTGLPVYPYLSSAVMDAVERTDTLGHWCRHFSAQTAYSLDTVAQWYRRTLRGASETDLTHDASYGRFPQLLGIKLGIGVDYVAVYKTSAQATTSIDLFRCSSLR